MIRLFIDVEKDNTFSEEVDLVIESRLTYTLDETRDFGIVAVKSSKKNTSYKPFTMVKITKMDGTTLIDYMVIAKDNVSFYGRAFNKTTNQYEVYYKHELKLEQLTYLLTQHLCREFVFSQPADPHFEINGRGGTNVDMKNSGASPNVPYTNTLNDVGSNLYAIEQNVFSGELNKIVADTIRLHIQIRLRNEIAYFGAETLYFEESRFIQSFSFIMNVNLATPKTNDEDGYNLTPIWSKTFYKYSISDDEKAGNIVNVYFDIPKDEFLELKRYHEYNITFSKFQITNLPYQVAQSTATTFTYHYTISAFLEFNYLSYTHRDVIKKLALCTPIKFKSEIESSDYKPPFEVPETIDGIDLDAPSPQLNISQSNLFDAVSQWANYFSAIPTLTKENDTAPLVLGLEFPNRNNGNIIDEDKMSGIEFELSNDDESYKDGQLAILKNITTDENFIYPSKNGFASVRSGAYGIVDSEDLRIELPHNIKEIKKIFIPIKINLLPSTDEITLLDLSYFIVEKDVYDILDETFLGRSNKRYKTNCLYYTKGTNFIPIGTTSNPSGYWEGFTFDRVVQSAILRQYGTNLSYSYVWSPADVWHTLFRVEYTPLVNSLRVRVESDEKKADGEVLANQGSNQINVYRATANLYGLANRTGVEALNCSFKFTNWENRIKKGDILIRNNDYYYANIVSYIFYKDFIESYISFSKNFNRLSTYIGVDREKRFYEADNSLTKLSEDQINEYIYVFLSDETDTSIFQYVSDICVQKPLWSKLLYTFLGEEVVSGWDDSFNKSTLLFSTVNTYSDYQRYINGNWVDSLKSFTNGTITINGQEKTYTKLFIPSFVYYGKNQISFHVAMKEPIVAGSYIFGSENNYQKSTVVPYTDEVGNFDYAVLSFKTYKGSSLENEVAITQYLPFVFEDDLTKNNTEDLIYIHDLAYLKDTNEIFSIDYNLYFVKANKYTNNVFFGDVFFSDNIIFKGENAIKVNGIYYNADEQYTRYDLKGKGTFKKIGGYGATLTLTQIAFVNTSHQTTNAIFKVSINPNDVSVYTWNNFALVDENDNILLAINRPHNVNSNPNSLYFYIVSSNKRL